MKRLLLIISSFAIVVALTACSSGTSYYQDETDYDDAHRVTL